MFVFFIEKLVNCVDFSEIDFQYVDTPGQKAYPAAMLIRIIILGTIFCTLSLFFSLKSNDDIVLI